MACLWTLYCTRLYFQLYCKKTFSLHFYDIYTCMVNMIFRNENTSASAIGTHTHLSSDSSDSLAELPIVISSTSSESDTCKNVMQSPKIKRRRRRVKRVKTEGKTEFSGSDYDMAEHSSSSSLPSLISLSPPPVPRSLLKSPVPGPSADQEYSLLSSDDEETEHIQTSDEETTVAYYDGDEDLPVYSRESTGIKTLEAVAVLTGNINKDRVIKKPPIGISHNVTFLVGLQEIGGHWKNILSDHMRAWKAAGTRTHFVQDSRNGQQIVSEFTPGTSTVQLVRSQWLLT